MASPSPEWFSASSGSTRIGSILAVIFGHVALHQIARTGHNGRGMAIAAVVLGWIGVGTLALILLLAVAAGRRVM